MKLSDLFTRPQVSTGKRRPKARPGDLNTPAITWIRPLNAPGEKKRKPKGKRK